MTRLAKLSPEAEAWLLQEFQRIAELSPAGADKLISRIEETRRNLAEYPKLGPAGEIPGTRRVVVEGYILTTRERGGVVEIAAARHSRQADAYKPHEALDSDEETDEPGGLLPKPLGRLTPRWSLSKAPLRGSTCKSDGN